MKLAVSFTNFGPYHLARLRALAVALGKRGDELIAYETAGSERRYPWLRTGGSEPFDWVALFPDRDLEGLPRAVCRRAMLDALDRDRPDALGITGYARPESMAMLGWACRRGTPTVLMSESQEIDHPRVWWKEAVKRQRVSRFSAALVGGRRHADYLVRLGMPARRIAFGYNAVDNDRFTRLADEARSSPWGCKGLPARPYFIAVSRFVREKNLTRLVWAFAQYRQETTGEPWDLVICGGGPEESEIEVAADVCGYADSIHRPGFLQDAELARWLAHASGFVHPSLMEPWGLVANEAAACGLPLLLSDRAGCAETLVPDGLEKSGRRFDPSFTSEITASLSWLAESPEEKRQAMGRRAASIVSEWSPDRFARGMLEALELATHRGRRPRNAARRGVPL